MEGTATVIGIIVLCICMVLCWIYNFIRMGRGKRPVVWVRRGLYICGMGAVAWNFFRVFSMYEYSLTSMVLANVIAFVCILIAFIRSEKEQEKEKS